MSEIRLYYKIENISEEMTRFFYYNGYYNNNRRKLESYSKTVKNSEINDILEIFDTDKNYLLYYMNKFEYFKLMNQIKKYKTLKADISYNVEENENNIKDEIFEIIRLRNEFNAWFKFSGFNEPN